MQRRTDSVLDEELTVTLTRFEIMKIREWNMSKMRSAKSALDNIMTAPAKRSMRQVEYDFHSELCDRLYGVVPDEEDRKREHNETLKSDIEVLNRVMADLRERKEYLRQQLV